jgi:hypothetical protein
MEDWFRYGETFSVLFRLAGLLSPVEIRATADDRHVRLFLRRPLSALLHDSADSKGLLVFILFALCSTAFDGFHETRPWVKIFWIQIYPALQAFLAQPYRNLVPYYYYWQWAALVVSPMLYYAVYTAFVRLTRAVSHTTLPLNILALRFAYSLVPIVLAYNAAHYFSLLISQGAELHRLISDPFGFGWNLFGTAQVAAPVVLRAGFVWHMQVALILIGHILGVYCAHSEALRLFRNCRRALVSQIPMLLLMMLLTTLGLWSLSLPIAAGTVVEPG